MPYDAWPPVTPPCRKVPRPSSPQGLAPEEASRPGLHPGRPPGHPRARLRTRVGTGPFGARARRLPSSRHPSTWNLGSWWRPRGCTTCRCPWAWGTTPSCRPSAPRSSPRPCRPPRPRPPRPSRRSFPGSSPPTGSHSEPMTPTGRRPNTGASSMFQGPTI